MKKFIVVSRVIHDGRTYEPGAGLGLEDETAAPLLRAGAIKPNPVEGNKKAGK